MTTHTKEKVISTRTLYRDLPRIAQAAAKGERFEVTKNGKPLFSIGPVRAARGARYTLKNLQAVQWKGGKDTSKRVDEVVYGA